MLLTKKYMLEGKELDMAIEIITLKKFRKHINNKQLDQYQDLPVVYSCDDEGNGYDRVLFAPGGIVEDVEIGNDDKTFDKAVCIN